MKKRQATTEEKPKNKTNLFGSMSMVGLAIGGVVLVAAAVFAYNAVASPTVTASGGALSLTPSTAKVGNGKTVTVSIWEDSQTNPTNAVQANLSYTASRFQFVSIDTSGSAFPVAAQGDGGGGNVKIARGSYTNKTGSQLVAKVVLRATTNSGKANVSFSTGSAIIRVTDFKDILQKSTGGVFTLTK